ncbi:MAG TPA: phosphatase PAP2 family protein [Burkholderiales bacterium]|nr:phosphatase PAP2 family protein [Burkholderiales bacterium]
MSLLDPTLARIQRYDAWLCLRMNRALRYALVLHFFRAVSWLGNGIFWYALMLALLVQHRAAAALPVLHMAFVGIVCTAAYQLLKRGTVRPRPYQALQGVAFGAVPLDRFSFPSGHTLHAVAFTIVAAAHYPGLVAPLAVFTALTAASRIVLGLHYPSDVLAGAALGGLVAAASLGI